MYEKSKKLLPVLLSFVMLFALLAVLPPAVSADAVYNDRQAGGVDNPNPDIMPFIAGAAAPANLHVMNSSESIKNGITLEWTNNTIGEDHFSVEKKKDGEWAVIGTAAAGETTYHDSTLINIDTDEVYYYRVRAVFSANGQTYQSPYSGEATFTGYAPAWPSNLTATADATGVALKWTDNSAYEDRFYINRKTVGGILLEIATVPGGTAFYKDITAEAGVTYVYTVQAGFQSAAGNVYSDHSNEVAVTMPGATPHGSGSMSNFVKVNTYTPGLFVDVNEDSWYGYYGQRVIANAYEYGLMLGYGDNYFSPSTNMSVVEVIIVAARVHGIYMTGDGEEGLLSVEKSGLWSGKWYEGYMNYAVAGGIITATDFSDADLTRAATRAEMAYIFSRSLDASEFSPKNTVSSLPDVTAGPPYGDAIFMLYKAGVVTGDAGTGAFRPGDNITRAEAAAIISRVILTEGRGSGATYG